MTTQQLLGLKIGGVPEHFNLPWRLAIEEGKMRDIGLDLHWSDMSGGTGQMIRGLETGSIDIAVLLTEGITKAILQNSNVNRARFARTGRENSASLCGFTVIMGNSRSIRFDYRKKR